jgi:uncharacterized protein YukE
MEVKMDREKAIRQWDKARKYIADGGSASWPGDMFESYLDRITELEQEVERLREALLAATERAAEIAESYICHKASDSHFNLGQQIAQKIRGKE